MTKRILASILLLTFCGGCANYMAREAMIRAVVEHKVRCHMEKHCYCGHRLPSNWR